MDVGNLNIIVEANIPFIKGLLEPFGKVTYLESEAIDAGAVREADALFVRTRTKCGETLLGGSRCRFVATATIGTDHIDKPWCDSHGISVYNAPGCNAPAVAQYVMASVMQLINRPLSQYRIGIVGAGHVGSIVERWARALNMEVLVCDPPRQRQEGGTCWTDLATIARKADIITFHTPLSYTGPDATYHLADGPFFSSLRRGPVIINCARGEIVDTAALIGALDRGYVHSAVIDCWEKEPDISAELLSRAAIATPHIAGYSYEGKVRATRMVLDAFAGHFGIPEIAMRQKVAAGAARIVSARSILSSYDPIDDSDMLKRSPASFETLRNSYVLRHEITSGRID